MERTGAHCKKKVDIDVQNQIQPPSISMGALELWTFPPDHNQLTSPTLISPSPNFDKDLPPMPGPSADSQEEREREVGRKQLSADWVGMESESGTSDVGEYDFSKQIRGSGHDAVCVQIFCIWTCLTKPRHPLSSTPPSFDW